MGSPIGFPPPPQIGGGAGFRMPGTNVRVSRASDTGVWQPGPTAPPGPTASTEGKCPTCGQPRGGAGAMPPPGMPPPGGAEQPDPAWEQRQALRAGGGGFQPPAPPEMPRMPSPGTMPGPRPGLEGPAGFPEPASRVGVQPHRPGAGPGGRAGGNMPPQGSQHPGIERLRREAGGGGPFDGAFRNFGG
jgi:hypothetical protein